MISLSNFIKQRYVINLDTEKVVINSDERYKAYANGEKMDSLSFPNVEVMADEETEHAGFVSGLYAEEVTLEPQPDPEEILAEARQQADEILARASAKVTQMEKEAQEQALLLYEQKRQEGYAKGCADAESELEIEKTRIRAEYETLQQDFQKEYENKMDSMEQDLVEVMIEVFHKVFHVQFDNKKQILLHLIKDTLLDVEVGKTFSIRVAENNFKYIESHVTEIKEKIGNDVSIDVINDVSLKDGDCIIETETGVYNCGIDMVLENLEKDIRILCR